MHGSRLRHATMALGVFLVALVPVVGASLVDINPDGGTQGVVSVSGTGDAVATCLDILVGCVPGVAASALGDAQGGVAATYSGNANATYLAVSGLGASNSSNVAVSGADSAKGGLLAVSLMGDAKCKHVSPCYAVSLTGEGSTMGGCRVLRAGGLSAYCGQGLSDEAWWLLLS